MRLLEGQGAPKIKPPVQCSECHKQLGKSARRITIHNSSTLACTHTMGGGFLRNRMEKFKREVASTLVGVLKTAGKVHLNLWQQIDDKLLADFIWHELCNRLIPPESSFRRLDHVEDIQILKEHYFDRAPIWEKRPEGDGLNLLALCQLYDDAPEVPLVDARCMLILDAVFLVSFLIFLHATAVDLNPALNPLIEVFSQPGMYCNLSEIKTDMWLFENQIPLSLIGGVLEAMYSAFGNNVDKSTIDKLLHVLIVDAIKSVLYILPGECANNFELEKSMALIPFSECRHLQECLYRVLNSGPSGDKVESTSPTFIFSPVNDSIQSSELQYPELAPIEKSDLASKGEVSAPETLPVDIVDLSSTEGTVSTPVETLISDNDESKSYRKTEVVSPVIGPPLSLEPEYEGRDIDVVDIRNKALSVSNNPLDEGESKFPLTGDVSSSSWLQTVPGWSPQTESLPTLIWSRSWVPADDETTVTTPVMAVHPRREMSSKPHASSSQPKSISAIPEQAVVFGGSKPVVDLNRQVGARFSYSPEFKRTAASTRARQPAERVTCTGKATARAKVRKTLGFPDQLQVTPLTETVGDGRRSVREYFSLPTVTNLRKAGIAVKGDRSPGCRVKFRDSLWILDEATLYISQLSIDDNTEKILRNLVAYEIVSAQDNDLITYLSCMGDLIDDEEDVRLLKEGEWPVITDNHLGDDKDVAVMFNNLLQNCTVYDKNELHEIRQRVRSYYEKKWRRTCVEFCETHCSKPWIVISLLVASVILILASVQTVYSVLGYY